MQHTSNVEQTELDKFSKMAHQWWDLTGPCQPLHAINPIRLAFVKKYCDLQNKSLIDVGCGGGIFSEALAREGAQVTGIDQNADLINVAKLHLYESHTSINYIKTDVAEFAAQHPQQFDIITCMELLEHVPDPQALVENCVQLLKPNGSLFISTINRNFLAYLKAVIGAEYILNLLPRGTHDYAKFIKPSELAQWCRPHTLALRALQGLSYNPLQKKYFACDDVSVNYMAYFQHEN